MWLNRYTYKIQTVQGRGDSNVINMPQRFLCSQAEKSYSVHSEPEDRDEHTSDILFNK